MLRQVRWVFGRRLRLEIFPETNDPTLHIPEAAGCDSPITHFGNPDGDVQALLRERFTVIDQQQVKGQARKAFDKLRDAAET